MFQWTDVSSFTISLRRLHARIVDQSRGAAKVRDPALGGGVGATFGPVAAALGAPGVARGGDRVRPAPTTPSPDHDPLVVHVAEPAAEEEPLDVLHQHGDGPLAAAEEEGHLPALQPPDHVGDPDVRRRGPVRRAGDPRPQCVPSCAHALRFHSHLVAAATPAAAAAAAAPRANGGSVAADAAAIGARCATHTGLGAGAGAQLASGTAAARTDAAAAVAGHRRGERDLH